MPKKLEPKWRDWGSLFQELLADIRFCKSQQWLISTYAIGLYTAFISIIDKLNEKNCNDLVLIVCSFVFIILILIVIVYGCILINLYTVSIKNARFKKDDLIKKFPDLKEYLPEKGKDINLVFIFYFVIVLGGLIALADIFILFADLYR